MTCNAANKNLLQGSKFKLNFDRLPDVSFFCTKVNIPGISLSVNARATPFVDFPHAGDKIEYSSFDATFIINESLSPWKEVHDWMRGLGFPTSFDEYKGLENLLNKRAGILTTQLTNPQYSDGVVSIFSNKNNPIVRVSYKDLFPIDLSEIQFDTKMTADDVLTATASFRYSYYNIEVV